MVFSIIVFICYLVGRSDATVGRSDATVGRSDATVGRSDAMVGRSDATVGRSDAAPPYTPPSSPSGKATLKPAST